MMSNRRQEKHCHVQAHAGRQRRIRDRPKPKMPCPSDAECHNGTVQVRCLPRVRADVTLWELSSQ